MWRRGGEQPHICLWGLSPATLRGAYTALSVFSCFIFYVSVAFTVAKPGWPLGHPTSPTCLSLVKSDAAARHPLGKLRQLRTERY